MKRSLLLSIATFATLCSSAQRYIGLEVVSGSVRDQTNTNFPMASNAVGEVYCAIPFYEPIVLGGITLTPVQNLFDDIALVKLSPTGQVIWAKSFGGNNGDTPHRIAIDGEGQVYVSWQSGNGVSYYFDETGTTTNFPNLGAPFYGLTCFDANGATLWHLPGVFGLPELAALTNAPGVFVVDRGAIRKVDPDGNVIWQTTPQPVNAMVPLAATVVGNRLAIAGYGGSTGNAITVDTVLIGVEYLNGAVVFLMDTSGSALWGRSVGNFNGAYGERIRHLSIDLNGDALYCGLDQHSGALSFGGSTLLNPAGPGNGFVPVLKFDLQGNEVWGRCAYGAGASAFLHAMTVGADGDVYFGGKCNFNSLVLGSIVLNGSGNGAYIAKLSSDGVEQWMKYEPSHGVGFIGVNSILRSMLALSDGTLLTGNYFWSGLFEPVRTGCLQATNANNQGMYFSRIDLLDTEPFPQAEFNHSMSGDLFFGRAPEQEVPTTFAWTFGDGGTGSGETVAHVYTNVGSYQVCLSASNTCGTAQHCVFVDHPGLRAIEPRKGGQGGLVSAMVMGGGFGPGTTFRLTRAGEPDIVPSNTTVGNSAALFGRLDLDGAVLGMWNVEATIPGLGTFLLPDAFEVQARREPRMKVEISGHRMFRSNLWGQQTIRVSNTGNEDAVLVPLHIEMPDVVEVIWFASAIDRHSVPGNDDANTALDLAGGYTDDLVFSSPAHGIKRIELIIPLVGANSYVDYRIWMRAGSMRFTITASAFPPLIGSRALVDATIMPQDAPYLRYMERAAEWTYGQTYAHAGIAPYIHQNIRNYANGVGGTIGGTGGWPYGSSNPPLGQIGGIGQVNLGPNTNLGGNGGYATPPLVVNPPWSYEGSGNGTPPPPGPPGGVPPPPPPVTPPPPGCNPNGCCSGPCDPPTGPWPYDDGDEETGDDIAMEWDPDGDGVFEPFDPPRPPGDDEEDDLDIIFYPPLEPDDEEDPDDETGCDFCDDYSEDDVGFGDEGGQEECDGCDPASGDETLGDGGDSDQSEIEFVASRDPNAIYGPMRNGDYYLSNRRNHGYTITFENLESATASARSVIVIDTLDLTRFDPYSFRFNTITLGDSAVLFPDPQVWDGNYLIDMTPQCGLFVGVHAAFDPSAGIVRVEFTSLDPVSLSEPADPLAGFLPPNTTASEGSGSISYFVDFRAGIGHGESVSNRAIIYFDDNEPIVTNTHTNIMDLVKPTSQVAPLPAVTTDQVLLIDLSNSSDDMSGIAYFHVFVSENGHRFRRFIVTPRDQVPFPTRPGRNYRFFSRAVDKAGNVEDYPVQFWYNPDAETDVTVGIPERELTLGLRVQPNPTNANIHYMIDLPWTTEVEVELLSLVGEVVVRPIGVAPRDMTVGAHRLVFPAGQLAAGAYLLRVSTSLGSATAKVMVE
ncbi:MAG: PKD domain-containing protein [Flavobacteriales bacterium]|nr:PKD domain-containing protein [Flavobacteriales bacterium]